jgi:hypothetical protein
MALWKFIPRTWTKKSMVSGWQQLRPAPITFLDDEAGKGGQLEIARLLFDELESTLLQQGNKRHLSGSADLFAGPARRWVEAPFVCRSEQISDLSPAW